MENCITETRRLLRLLEKISGDKQSPFINKEMRKFINSISGDIVGIRDAVEHIDDRIHKNYFGENAPLMIQLSKNGDTIKIGEDKLALEDLALVLRKLHIICWKLLKMPEK